MASQPERSGHRVLLVEDHDALTQAIEEIMRACGLEVRVASTGRAALDETPAFEPDIVLCDLSLPDMDGLEVARALRAMPGGANLVIALHTAISDTFARDLERSASGVVDQIVPKPIMTGTLDALVSLVRERAAGTISVESHSVKTAEPRIATSKADSTP